MSATVRSARLTLFAATPVRVVRIDDAMTEVLEQEREVFARERAVLHNHDDLPALSVRNRWFQLCSIVPYLNPVVV